MPKVTYPFPFRMPSAIQQCQFNDRVARQKIKLVEGLTKKGKVFVQVSRPSMRGSVHNLGPTLTGVREQDLAIGTSSVKTLAELLCGVAQMIVLSMSFLLCSMARTKGSVHNF